MPKLINIDNTLYDCDYVAASSLGVKLQKNRHGGEKSKKLTCPYLGNQDGAHQKLIGFGLGAAPRAQNPMSF